VDEPLKELLRLQATRKRLAPGLGVRSRTPRPPPAPLMVSELRRLASLAQLSEDVREARIARLEAWQAAVANRIDQIDARIRAESAELRARIDGLLTKVK
jgi:hypothetical protein